MVRRARIRRGRRICPHRAVDQHPIGRVTPLLEQQQDRASPATVDSAISSMQAAVMSPRPPGWVSGITKPGQQNQAGSTPFHRIMPHACAWKPISDYLKNVASTLTTRQTGVAKPTSIPAFQKSDTKVLISVGRAGKMGPSIETRPPIVVDGDPKQAGQDRRPRTGSPQSRLAPHEPFLGENDACSATSASKRPTVSAVPSAPACAARTRTSSPSRS